jgi:hypothetical protein
MGGKFLGEIFLNYFRSAVIDDLPDALGCQVKFAGEFVDVVAGESAADFCGTLGWRHGTLAGVFDPASDAQAEAICDIARLIVGRNVRQARKAHFFFDNRWNVIGIIGQFAHALPHLDG